MIQIICVSKLEVGLLYPGRPFQNAEKTTKRTAKQRILKLNNKNETLYYIPGSASAGDSLH